MADRRDYQAGTMRAVRKATGNVAFRECANKPRRDACLLDQRLFLKTYFPDKFPNPWTVIQIEMLDAVERCSRTGGDQALAGPRGCAKTTCTEGAIIFGIFSGCLKFALILTATGPDSGRILDNIKFAVETSDLLRDDFPAECDCIRALEGAPQRGNTQTFGADFVKTNIEWSADRVVMPTIAGSPSSGAVILCRGIDGSIRGLNVYGKRPDFVLLDDIDTRESADSPFQTEKRERAIERDVAGLAGPGKKIAKVMLCTPQNRTCIAYKYTDPKQKPAWNGKRFKLLAAMPTDTDALEEYCNRRKVSQQAGPNEVLAYESADKWYIENRERIESGGIATDPLRLVPPEVSAIQHAYNLICDHGLGAFLSEYQSDPQEEEGPQESGITAALVGTRLNKFERRFVVSAKCVLTIGIDIAKYWSHWVAVAFDENAAGYVVDYGAHHMKGQSPEDRVKLSLEESIADALHTLRVQFEDDPFLAPGGEIISPRLVLIDSSSGLHQRAVYQFHRNVGRAVYVPAKGFARGRGSSPFHPGKESATRKVGERWAKAQQDKEWKDVWLHEFDADYWKRFVHQRFLTPTLDDDGSRYRRGSLSLWTPPEAMRMQHKDFCRHIEAEIWVEKFEPDKGVISGWKPRHKDNHYLDATTMACVGASMCGVRVVGEVRKREVKSMSEMQANARKAG
jgi:hypothetical protein